MTSHLQYLLSNMTHHGPLLLKFFNVLKFKKIVHLKIFLF